ncbi:MAG: hypothetical protein LUH47_02315, partial [Clostridiales bacterium]|nr:hypothetical protein [Clostridiales bacterium]
DYGFAAFFDMPVFKKDGICVEGKRLQLLLSTDDRDQTGLYLYEAVLSKGKRVYAAYGKFNGS